MVVVPSPRPEIITVPVGAVHVAHLEPLSGVGFLVLPSPGNDLWLNGSLNGSDWDSAVKALSAMGWEPLLDQDGSWIEEGLTEDGRPVIAVIAAEPVIGDPSLTEYAAAREALSASVGS